jgi:inosine-uridine nucleoside N-ribohydrolase
MGGWVEPPAPGLPDWGPARDFNIQWDARAAALVAGVAAMTLVTLPVTLLTHLRARDLPRLRAAGRLGNLIADQTEAHARESGKDRLARAHRGLPDDLLNFHYDPLACAVALGWPGATVEERRLRPEMQGEILRWIDDPDGRVFRVVVDVDGEAFSEAWIAAVEAAHGR